MNITVFCSASDAVPKPYKEMAARLGMHMAQRGHTLVYGGGKVGLMGEVANACLSNGGKVIGVIPQALMDREVAHVGLSELHKTETMHQRKQMMHDMSDVSITIPGGFGTLDEWVELVTWRQLGLHQQPIAICNFKQFFDPLFAQMKRMEEEGFLHNMRREDLLIHEDELEVLKMVEQALNK